MRSYGTQLTYIAQRHLKTSQGPFYLQPLKNICIFMLTMKFLFRLITFLLLMNLCYGQSDTTFYDKDWKVSKRNAAHYYRLVTKDGTRFIAKDYFINNILQMAGTYTSLDPDVKDGTCVEYNERGKKLSSINYSNNIPLGLTISYSENGKDSLVYDYQADGTMFFLSEGQYINIQGKKQFVMIQGKGNPTVVFITGKGRSLNDFRTVYTAISPKTQTFAYDRMGIGQSESINNKRTVDTMAYELNLLLTKANIKPPYILVGHSLGGYVIRCFQKMYPKKVAGLIYVDSAYETEYKNGIAIRTAEDKIKYTEKQKTYLNRPERTKGHNAESEGFFDHDASGYATNQKIVKDIKIPTNIPIIVYMSTMPDDSNPYSKQEMEARLKYYDEWKKQAPQMKLVTTSKSGHFIQVDEPGLIIDGINAMLDKIKTSGQ
jgi:pimeloyl-ACP methyl ester carboxylesterase